MSRRAAGLRAWLLQRISAVYLALYVVYFLLAMALFFLALSIHAWVGVRDVIIDYVHPAGLRLLLLCGLGVVLLGSLLWALLALAEVA